MLRVRKYISIGVWLYGAALAIPETAIDDALPAPAATMVNGTLGLVEDAAAQGFDLVRANFGDAAASGG